MDLSIVIVSWNVKNLVRENLNAIIANSRGIEYEIFVVDNDSKDDTAQMIKTEFASRNEIKLIANNYNAGFSKANNQAIKLSRGRYVLLLNPDMRVMPGTLEKMIKWLDEHKQAGVGGCHLIKESGETVPQIRHFPGALNQLAIVLKLPHLFPSVLDGYLQKDFDYEKDSAVESIRGSFFMIRREVLEKVGWLDERYFIWFEEVDYCRRVRVAGWEIMYAADIKCVDYVGRSFSQVKRDKTQEYFRDSMLKYFKKWQPIWQYYILKIFWPVGIFIARLSEIANLKSRRKT
ncbi:MAG: glycosyltransferase family 2 protein [bacterium]|nr:glycosyltransferase family 2 protein [bacterium]